MRAVRTESNARRDFLYPPTDAKDADLSGETNAELGRYVRALLHVKVNTLPCVHADACFIFYLEALISDPMEYSTWMTSYCKANVSFSFAHARL